MMIDLRQGPANVAPGVADKQRVLREQLGLTSADDLRPVRTETDELGFVHERLQPYYLGVKVEHATISLHERGGKIEMLSGDYERPSVGASAQPALTEAVALQRAVAAIGARRYMWQDAAEEAALKQQTQKPGATYQPKGELVWVGDFRQPEANRPIVLAWKFNIYAAEPVSRDWVYIDARTGQLVMRNAIIKHVNAPGASFATRYLGARTSITDNTGSGFRLRETATGKGVTTLNLRKSTTFSTAIDFVDNDNNWTAAEHNNANFDNAALDAHLGAQVTQDYWTNVHGRDSYDDRGTVLLSYVHYGNGTDNAFWNGTAMLYGDGSTFFKPLTSIDVCAHEVGHAVCETTADLVYQNESGALNEGLSDIWGACIEHHLDPTKQVYLIGEDICKPSFGLALRSMSNPNQFDQPDTYLGTDWATGTADNGGVHTNSGVLNFWFYLLSNGGSGTNDNGTAFNVTAISIAKAAFITYRAERLYMTTTTNYAGARKATMQAAVDLYGLGSAEVTNTARAWRAVGLGEGTPTLTGFSPTSGLAGTIVTLTGTNLGTTLSVTFNGAPATIATLTSSTSVAVTVPPSATTGPIVVTTSGGSATSATNFVITASGPAPVIASFTPVGGQVQGGSVTITGSNFSTTSGVSFNGTAALFAVLNATTIATTVPVGATTGALTVTTSNGTATAPTTFTVLPNITSFTPTSAIAGASVVITGTSFTGALTVKFNGTYATSFTVNSSTQITAVVAAGTTTGPITVRTPSGTATSATNFTLTPSLAFTSFSPTSGAPGTVVNIQGRGFTGTTAVTFGGVNAPTFTVASDLELWATVPTGGQTGNIVLSTPLGTATSPSAFTVIIPGAPTITSFTPTFGPVGTGVTLTGTNFTGATAVTFNGTAAAFSVLNATTITTTVPAGATNGPIGVTTPVNVVFSSTNFTLPPANDLCTGTLPTLTCGGSVTGTTVGATTTGDPTATCVTSITAPGVFYRFVGTGGSVTMTTCGATTTFDTKLYVFTGTCGSYVCVTGNDDTSCGSQSTVSSVTFNSVAGTNYFILVAGFNASTGPFILNATCVPVAPTLASLTPNSGLVGASITLTGTSFTGATGVSFNGTAAVTFSVTNATTATATVPVGATSGNVTITTPSGTSNGVAFTVITNQAPTALGLSPQSVAENTAGGTAIGNFSTTDPDAGNTHTYSFVTGVGATDNGAFSISGNQLVITAAPDFETKNAYAIRVRTTDQGGLFAEQAFTINVNNVNETPSISGQTRSIPENSANGSAVGTPLTASDPDAGATLTYSITAGNTGGAFSFGSNGQLTVANSAALNFESTPIFNLTVQVSDGSLSSSAAVTVSLTNVNEAPSISPQTRSIPENSANGSAVGTPLTASDPDAGATLTYSITAGNTGGAFSFGSNGQLQVANSAALDFETTPTFSLTVQVSDGGLTSSATVTVNLSDTVEDLIVSTTAPVAGGSYNNITVTPTGVATLAGAVTVSGSVTVQTGGVFDDGCQVLTGPGTFTLQTGATMRVCHAQGLATTGATGAVQVTGARSFAPVATYVYTGTAPQATGLGLPATVDQLSVENPTTVTLSRNLSIRRQLTLASAGNLAPTDFVLTLLSDATGTAFVVNAGSGVVSGPATVQRFLTPGSATGLGYRHLSAPVTNTRVSDLTVAGANGFMPVVNAAYNTAPVPTNVRPYPSIFGFDETRGGAAVTDFSRGYFSPTALTSALVPGRGYSVYMRPLTPDFVGTLGNGDVTVAGLTHTGAGNVGGQKPGWHLLGNPYPAPIDWDLVTVPTGMDAGISVFQSTGGNNGIYRSRANGLGTLPDGLVPMGQAFFARVTGAGPVDFTFTNAHRVTSYANPTHFRAGPEARPVLTLTLHAVGASPEETDEATVYFETGATAAADAQFDGVKPARNVGAPTLVSLTPNSEELAVNGLSTDALTTGLTVPLLLDVPAAGTYELSVQKLMNFGTAPITLLDRLTGTRYDLTTAPVITYTAQQGGESRNRFALVIGTATTATPKLTLWPNPAHHAVRVTLPANTEAVTILDATGRTVRTQPATTTDLTVDLAGLPAGVYVVKAGAATARLVVE